MLSWAHIGLAGSLGALLVGGCGARAVSRKTPIYFIALIVVIVESKCQLMTVKILIDACTQIPIPYKHEIYGRQPKKRILFQPMKQR